MSIVKNVNYEASVGLKGAWCQLAPLQWKQTWDLVTKCHLPSLPCETKQGVEPWAGVTKPEPFIQIGAKVNLHLTHTDNNSVSEFLYTSGRLLESEQSFEGNAYLATVSF